MRQRRVAHKENCCNQTCFVWHTDFAEMASLRLLSALNMPLWLGGTRSAKATQSMAFRATRRAAILSVRLSVWREREGFNTHTHPQNTLNTQLWTFSDQKPQQNGTVGKSSEKIKYKKKKNIFHVLLLRSVVFKRPKRITHTLLKKRANWQDNDKDESRAERWAMRLLHTRTAHGQKINPNRNRRGLVWRFYIVLSSSWQVNICLQWNNSQHNSNYFFNLNWIYISNWQMQKGIFLSYSMLHCICIKDFLNLNLERSTVTLNGREEPREPPQEWQLVESVTFVEFAMEHRWNAYLSPWLTLAPRRGAAAASAVSMLARQGQRRLVVAAEVSTTAQQIAHRCSSSTQRKARAF